CEAAEFIVVILDRRRRIVRQRESIRAKVQRKSRSRRNVGDIRETGETYVGVTRSRARNEVVVVDEAAREGLVRGERTAQRDFKVSVAPRNPCGEICLGITVR